MPGRVDYFFGELSGHPVGAIYAGRREAMQAGLHDNWVPGISGNPSVGADCIALNKGYVDDEDHGEWILYTGAGGNDPQSKRQIAHQDLGHHHNAALVYSEQNGLPVRVLRGYRGERPYAPKSGYRYDGLYKVTRHWSEMGRDGFRIWRFHLLRLTVDEALPWTPKGQEPAVGPVGPSETKPSMDPAPAAAGVGPPQSDVGNETPARVAGIVQRIVRSSRVSQRVKDLYGHSCQVCGSHLDLPVGNYSEGAHVRALGSPHDGPDVTSNVLCLCPNHHVLFDKGGIYVDSELMVRNHRGEALSPLILDASHKIDAGHLQYHRQHFGYEATERVSR